MFSIFNKKETNLPELRLHNTLSGNLERFEPLGRVVKMYNCGPTVYDRQHIGNLRPYVFADVLARTLRTWHWDLKQVINITDVGHLTSDADEGEDKMEASARKQGRSAQEIAQEITQGWFTDLDELGIDRARITFPRATEYIGQQIALVEALEQKGYAYRTADGVYFDTSKFPGYGKLGHIDLKGEMAGARVEENLAKHNPHDFALWKLSPQGAKRQQEWQSPWGPGFPGWHIECTAMIFALLGKQIDIHTGGMDHISIHHNNEIAQAEALTNEPYARYWMHNEFITIEGRKVSKSIGNTIYLSQLVDRGLFARSLRYWYLTGHYRSPMNFTWEAVEAANTALVRLRKEAAEAKTGPLDEKFLESFYEAIANDLNTPQALALIWENIKKLNRETLHKADEILGLGLAEAKPAKTLLITHGDLPQGIQELLASREAARQNKDWARADEFRQEIESAGYTLKDTPAGPQVTKK